MKLAVIGNPITDTSCGKFLLKMVDVLKDAADDVIVLNDGYPPVIRDRCRTIPCTGPLLQFASNSSGPIGSIFRFILAQVGFTIGLARTRRVRVVLLFPITMVMPAFFARILGKRVILYEAQDILAEEKSGLLGSLRFAVLMATRNTVLLLSNIIVVEGKSIIMNNRLEKYASKIRVNPQHVDSLRYRSIVPCANRPPTAGFIGTLDDRKGCVSFAHGVRIAAANRSDLRFVIVGHGPLKGVVKNVLAREASTNIVEIKDTVPEEEFVQLLNSLRLVVMPSKAEGLPNLLLEAMASGTPVLASRAGAISDVVIDGVNGYLLADNSPHAIASGILRAMSDPQIITVSRSAQQHIESAHTLERTLGVWRNILMEAECA